MTICRRCLRPTNDTIGDFGACVGCITQTASELDEVRPIFNAMINGGIARTTANEVMAAYLGSLQPRPH